MPRQSEIYTLVGMALIASALGLSFADARQKLAREELAGTKDKFTQNFLAQHEIRAAVSHRSGRVAGSEEQRHCDQSSADRTLQWTNVAGPARLHSDAFAIGLVNPRRLLVLPNGDVLVAEQSAGYLTLL